MRSHHWPWCYRYDAMCNTVAAFGQYYTLGDILHACNMHRNITRFLVRVILVRVKSVGANITRTTQRKCWSEFLCLGDYLAPPRQVGGFAPRGALGRHPSADPRRWRTAGGPVAGAQLGIFIC
jgi:hypothetical protein